VIDVFVFLTYRSMKNRFARRLARLREPRYLLPFVVSLLWFGSAIFRPFSRGGGRMLMFTTSMLPPDFIPAVTLLGGVVIFAWVAVLWIVPSKTAELVFSPAEIHFLFTAPLTRQQVLQYKLARAQIGILLGAFVSALIFGARLFTLGGWARVVAFWLFFAIGYLHGIGASFVRTDLMASGLSGVRRRLVTIGVVLAVVAAAVIGARESWSAIANAAAALMGPGSHPTKANLALLTHALATAGSTGLPGIILWPFLVLPRLLFAQTTQEFLRMGGVGIVILAVHYWWVLRTDASFEEASVELSQRMADKKAARRDAARTGGILTKKAKQFPWRLKPMGRPEVALVWKNLVNLTRVTPVRALIGIGGILFATMTWTIQHARAHANLWYIAAIIAGATAAFTCVVGPLFVRNDLREDLFRIDVLRTFPLAGRAILLAEILGSWVVLAGIQWLTMLFAGFAFFMSGAATLGDVAAPWVLWGLASAVIVLPAVTLVAIALQNALVVLFPAWVQLGNSRARGFEASGQRILTLFGTTITMTLAALPAAAVGGIVAWFLAHAMGPAALVPGGIVAATWMVGEVVLGCSLLGKVLDRLDPSTAGIEAQEA
jgi:ABC-2 type transport system permease protein